MLQSGQIFDVLHLLGDDVVQEILEHLTEAERSQVELQLKSNTVPAACSSAHFDSLKQFEACVRFALDHAITSPRLHVPDDSAGLPEELNSAPPASLTRHSLEKPLLGLQTLSPYQLGRALEHEQGRTVAILLSQLPSKFSAEVLSTLPEGLRNVVVRDLSKPLPTPPVLVDRIARIALQRAAIQPALPPDRRDNIDRLAEVLREMPKPMRMLTLKEIRQQDPETSLTLTRRLYRFEDLLQADKHRIQQMLGEIDATTLATALFGAPEDISNRVMDNLSRRAKQSLLEEMQFQSHVPEARVSQARGAVIEVIARLDQDQE